MKNFIENNEIPGWEDCRLSILDIANNELKEYILNMPQEQKARYFRIKSSDLIKMYALPFYYGSTQCNCNGPKEELLNFTIDSPEQNYNLENGPYVKQIKEIAGPLIDCYNLSFFNQTKNMLPSSLHTGWFFFYKPGMVVREPNGHGFDTIMIHMLLDDIKSGQFRMEVNGEERFVSKKGECFIFNGILPHNADCSGYASFVSFAYNKLANS